VQSFLLLLLLLAIIIMILKALPPSSAANHKSVVNVAKQTLRASQANHREQ
jgi:hypothetical protein